MKFLDKYADLIGSCVAAIGLDDMQKANKIQNYIANHGDEINQLAELAEKLIFDAKIELEAGEK